MKKRYLVLACLFVGTLFTVVPAAAQIKGEVLAELAGSLVGKPLQRQVFVALKNKDWNTFWKLYKQDKRIVNLRTPVKEWQLDEKHGGWKPVDSELVELEDKFSPLEFAIRDNRITDVKKLINAGAAVNINGGSALRMAVWKENLELVDILLKSGAKPDLSEGNFFAPNKEYYNGWTALRIAIHSFNVPIFNRLLESGATLVTADNVAEAFGKYVFEFSGDGSPESRIHQNEADYIWRTIAKNPSLAIGQLYKAAMSDMLLIDYPQATAQALRLGLAGYAKTHRQEACQAVIRSKFFADLHKQHKYVAAVLDEFKKDPKAFAKKYID